MDSNNKNIIEKSINALENLSKSQSSDLSFNEDFRNEFKKVFSPASTLIAHYKCALMEVETKFNVLNTQFSIDGESNPIESIKTRIKSFESILIKMQSKGIEPSVEAVSKNINDIAGIRIICSFINDIYTLADSFLQQDDITLIQKKDYIKNPKENGYRSLHLIVSVPIFLFNEKRNVKVEVQLRTIAMDFWASLEHKIRYKKNIPPEVLESLSSELLQCADNIAKTDAEMQHIKTICSIHSK